MSIIATVAKLNINVAVINRQKIKPKVAANFLGAKSVIFGFRFIAFEILMAENFNKLNLPLVNALIPKSNVRNNIAQ